MFIKEILCNKRLFIFNMYKPCDSLEGRKCFYQENMALQIKVFKIKFVYKRIINYH